MTVVMANRITNLMFAMPWIDTCCDLVKANNEEQCMGMRGAGKNRNLVIAEPEPS